MLKKYIMKVCFVFVITFIPIFKLNIIAESNDMSNQSVNYQEYISFVIGDKTYLMADMTVGGEVDLSELPLDIKVKAMIDVARLQKDLGTTMVINNRSYMSYNQSIHQIKRFDLVDNYDGTYSFQNNGKEITLKDLSKINTVKIVLSDSWDSEDSSYLYGSDIDTFYLFKIRVENNYPALVTIQYMNKNTNEIYYNEQYDSEYENIYGESVELQLNMIPIREGYMYDVEPDNLFTIYCGYQNSLRLPVVKLSAKVIELDKLIRKVDNILMNSDIMFTKESKNELQQELHFAKLILSKNEKATEQEIAIAFNQLNQALMNLSEIGEVNEEVSTNTSDSKSLQPFLIIGIVVMIVGLILYKKRH